MKHKKDMTLLPEDKQKEGGILANKTKCTEYIERKLFLKILKKHGEDKIFFATDSPWSNAVVGMEYIRKLPISEKGKNRFQAKTQSNY